nr:nitrous oxide-stimulated promoter family protein [uncultured Desulfobulbus sp.]
MTHKFIPARLKREAKTVDAMIRCYCRDHHQPEGPLCNECEALLAYAHTRLRNCPFQEHKTSCGQCSVHCYSPKQRERIREVMRSSGPKMLFSHPVLALLHLLDGLRKPGSR